MHKNISCGLQDGLYQNKYWFQRINIRGRIQPITCTVNVKKDLNILRTIQ